LRGEMCCHGSHRETEARLRAKKKPLAEAREEASAIATN
jgi:hypothetical protein